MLIGQEEIIQYGGDTRAQLPVKLFGPNLVAPTVVVHGPGTPAGRRALVTVSTRASCRHGGVLLLEQRTMFPDIPLQ